MRCFGLCARVAALAEGLLCVACGEPLDPPAPPVARPVTLDLTVSDTIQAAGGRLRFVAVARDSAGATVPNVLVAWRVSDSARGRITLGGRFTAGPDSGRVQVTAAVLGTALSASLTVRVVLPGTVKWSWAAANAGGWMPDVGGPALAGDGTVYVMVDLPNPGYPQTFPGTLVAFTPDGTVCWTRTLLEVEGSTGPVVTPGMERIWLVGKRAYLLTPTGDVLWDTLPYTEPIPLFKAGAASPPLLVASMGERPVVFRADDQALLWEGPYAPLISWLVPPTITADGERILAKRMRDTLFLFDAMTGRVLRGFPDPDTSVDMRIYGRGTVVVGDRYYLPTRERLAAYDTSGTLLWLTETVGNGMTEPAVGPDGMLYVQDRTYGLGALDPNGTLRWKLFSVQPRWPWLGGAALGTGGVIYAAGIDAFWAVRTDGTPLWSFRADSAGVPQAFVGSPAIAPDGTVYTFTSTHVYAFWGGAPPEPNSPWPMWRHDAQRTGWAGYQGN